MVNAGWPEDESILDDADAIVIYADGTKVIGHGWEKMDELVREKSWRDLYALRCPSSVEQEKNTFFRGLEGFFQKMVFQSIPFGGQKLNP